MMLVRGPVSFYSMRFLLGAAEAGFFPGMILYLKRWFPAKARARAVAWFMLANPIAGIVGSPISGTLLGLHGAGLAGWQWMFLTEGVPAILSGCDGALGVVRSPAGRHLAEGRGASLVAGESRPASTGGVEPQARQLLAGSDRAENLDAFHRLLWRLGHMYGITLWLPSVIQSLSGLGNFATSLVAVLPFVSTTIAMVLVGASSDRTGERRWHTAVPAFLAALAMLTAAYGKGPALVIAGVGLGWPSPKRWLGRSGPWRPRKWPVSRRRRDRNDQLAGESGRVFRSGYHRTLSDGEWRVSGRVSGNWRDLGH